MNKDCFGYKAGKCTVLSEMVCVKKECSFYKTKDQYNSDREKYDQIAAARLNLLNKEVT